MSQKNPATKQRPQKAGHTKKLSLKKPPQKHSPKHLLITGGTGFIGTPLVCALHQRGHIITLLIHNHHPLPKALRTLQNIKTISSFDELSPATNIDGVINLAGTTVAKRWSRRYKEVLLKSRIGTTNALIKWLQNANNKPAFLISASGAGYDAEDTVSAPTTKNTKPFKGFAHELCASWEFCAQKAKTFGMRVVILRLGVVLGKKGGPLRMMLPFFRLGLGGRLGSGKQAVAWIHLDDVLRAVCFLMDDKKCDGPFNLVAPEEVTNATFAKQLAHTLKRPAFFHMPAFVVKLLFGEMGKTLLLGSFHAPPQKLRKAGFTFRFPKLMDALKDIF